MSEGHFEEIARREGCPHCRTPIALGPVEAVYVISLQEQPERFAKAADHLHAVGLCSRTLAYRAVRASNPHRGVWLSHARVARHALAAGRGNALIFEDDFKLLAPWPEIAARIRSAIEIMPPDWRGLYIGHRPFRCHFVGKGLVRAMSTHTHAYVANGPLLQWLATGFDADPSLMEEFGAHDFAMREMVGMYALYPSLARQRLHGRSFHGHRLEELAHLTHRPLELLAALRSKRHRRVMERMPVDGGFLRRLEILHEAREIHASGLFDSNYYRRQNPDVVAADFEPVGHYLRHGAKEGRWPNNWFESGKYAVEHAAEMKPGENPLVHYIRRRATPKIGNDA